MSKNIYDDLVNEYSLSKTLRFSLIPIGKTRENIDKKELLKMDEELALEYKKAKKIIDEYHKDFIEDCLIKFSNKGFSQKELEEANRLYVEAKKKRDTFDEKSKWNNEYAKVQKSLREKVAGAFDTSKIFGNNFAKKFMKETLPTWIAENIPESEREEKLKTIGVFNEKKFTTYFTGFNDNRENIYTKEEKSTGIAYRLIHENLPKFFDNRERYAEIVKKWKIDLSEVQKNMKDELGDRTLDEAFLDFTGFNACLMQRGIDVYNALLGGKTVEGEKFKRKGINEVVNLHRQRASEEEQKALKKLTLEPLHKQILSDQTSLSFVLDEIESDEEMQEVTLEFYHDCYRKLELDHSGEESSVPKKLSELINSLPESDTSKIYFRAADLTAMSNELFGDYGIIIDALKAKAEEKYPSDLKGKVTQKLEKEREDWRRKTAYFDIETLQNALDEYAKTLEEKDDRAKLDKKIIKDYFQVPLKDMLATVDSTFKDAEATLKEIAQDKSEESKKKRDKDTISKKIKPFFDAMKDLYWRYAPLYIEKRKGDEVSQYDKDTAFYASFDVIFEKALGRPLTKLYDKVRNFLTKKDFNIEKIKINFENSTLAGGWDKNKEPDNTCVILLKDDQFYLGVMDKHNNGLFEKLPKTNSGAAYQKMEYKLLPGPNKMLPKVFFSEKGMQVYEPSQEILKIRNESSHTKNGVPQDGYKKQEFMLEDCHAMIDFFKDSIAKHPEWPNYFDFKFSPTKSYESIDKFYKEVEHQGYSVSFSNVDTDYIDQCVNEGKLYLFQIYNKDFSTHRNTEKNKKASPNLHTLYWKALFQSDNLANVSYKLNGEAELFFRKASLKYEDKTWKEGFHVDDPKKKQPYAIIKNRRYAEDTFLFHVPITLNFKSKNASPSTSYYNNLINEHLKKNIDRVHILSLDRGERNLVYYTLINQKGEILEQNSLNYIGEKDYHAELDKKEGDRDKARKEWTTIGKIKELKAGYLSHVIQKIIHIATENNAIIVMEDLNFGFKRGRFKIEKQVYQKLEKALIDKLNYLVTSKKEEDKNKPGGYMQAYQLAAPFESFKDMGKQTGIMYYVPAYHTSKICPLTGFVDMVYPKYENLEKSRAFFSKFDAICYDKASDYFEFHLDYEKFFGIEKNKSKKSGEQDLQKTRWTLCSYGDRLERFPATKGDRDDKKNNGEKKKRWDFRTVNLTKELKVLFKEYAIRFESGNDFKIDLLGVGETEFFKKLTRFLKLTLQMRNTRSEPEEDWIISPVQDENGVFFDSRNAKEDFPKDADANGAYHIGLKGLMLLNRIRDLDESSAKKGKKDALKPISNIEWYNFVQEKPYKKSIKNKPKGKN